MPLERFFISLILHEIHSITSFTSGGLSNKLEKCAASSGEKHLQESLLKINE